MGVESLNRLLGSIQLRAPKGKLYEDYHAARLLLKKYSLAPFDVSFRNARAEYYRGGLHKEIKPYGSDFYHIWDLNIDQNHYDNLVRDFYDIFLCDKRWLSEAQTVIDVDDYPLIARFENNGPYQWGNVKIQKGDVVIDAGAHIGLFDILASFFEPSAIYSFEPVSETYNQLKHTLSHNRLCKNAHPVKAALSNHTSTAEISIDSKELGTSGLATRKKQRTETVITYALDEWVERNNIQKVDFIKANIEGAEQLLLDGAQKVLKEFAPKLALSTYHLDGNREALEQLIREANSDYRVEHYAGKTFAYAKNKRTLI